MAACTIWKNCLNFPLRFSARSAVKNEVLTPSYVAAVIVVTVKVASRFSALAWQWQILIIRDTLSCLGPDIQHKELPPTEVKGKTGKLEVFEIHYI